jgi:hypothetical protein
MLRSRAPILFLAFVVAACDATTAPPQPERREPPPSLALVTQGYVATQLPIYPSGINDNGVIVGTVGVYAARYHNGAMTILPRLPGVSGNHLGDAINRQGAMAGHIANGRGLFWAGPTQFPQQIIAPNFGPGSAPVTPYAINGSNVVVGSFRNSVGTRAFRWTPSGGLADITPRGFSSAVAADINDAGYVVGHGDLSTGTGTQRVALRWAPGAGSAASILPGSMGEAVAIRGNGDAFGRINSYTLRIWPLAGVPYSVAGPALGLPDDISPLGRLTGTTSRFAPVNPGRAFTIVGGTTTWLPVPNAATTAFTWTVEVNSCGSIAGMQMFSNGSVGGVLWTRSFACDLGGVAQP